MGEPNATDIPAAAAAESTSLFRATTCQRQIIVGICNVLPSFPLIFPNNFMKRFAQQQATWTSGPSFPSHIPDATAKHCSALEQTSSFNICFLTYQSKRLYNQSPCSHKTPNNEASQHRLDLGYPAMFRIQCVFFNQHARTESKYDLKRHVSKGRTITTW